MKKGCFLTVIITLTVIVATIFYLIKFHGEDLINIGKDKVLEFAESKLNSDLDNLQNKEYVDSLKFEMKKFFTGFENKNVEKKINKLEELSQNIELIIKDSKIDSLEFAFIKQSLKTNE
ncbi:MAG: hypothetical protein IPM32_14670 [Ignavibacteriae bacterium]|nr:hypothetical protein [Ignavibacteriota bacterium]